MPPRPLRILSRLLLFTASLTLPAQVTQRRGETYDEFNTRRIREETADHRNNNPTFGGPRPSERADWSAWDAAIERYNRRHAPAPSGPPPKPAETATNYPSAAAAQLEREMNANDRALVGYHESQRQKGSLPSALRLGQIFDSGLVAPGTTYHGSSVENAFALYHEVRSLGTPEQKVCYLGIIPALLNPKVQYTPGQALGFLKRDRDTNSTYQRAGTEGEFAERCLNYLASPSATWERKLVLALWYQHGEIGLGPLQAYEDFYRNREPFRREMMRKPLAETAREAEILRLLQSVQQSHPAIGSFFIGSMALTFPKSNPLYLQTLEKLAGALVPLPGDKDDTYARVFQEEARLLLANLHLAKKVPSPSDELALKLLRGCHSFRWIDARLRAADLVSRDQMENPQPLQSAIDDYESVVREDSARDFPIAHFKAALFRGLIKLTGLTDTSRVAPDPVGARAEFERARAIPFNPKDTQDEAHCRILLAEALSPDAAQAAKAAAELAADQREIWQFSTGLLHARGQGGLPRDATKALRLIQNALELNRGADSRIRGHDAIAAVEALRDLQREKLLPPQAEPVYAFLRDRAIRRDPMIGAANMDRRLSRAEANQPLVVTYRTIIRDLERITATPRGAEYRPATLLRHQITDHTRPLERELTLCLDDYKNEPAVKPWLDAFALKGPARIKALAAIKQPTAVPLVAALQAREKIVRGATITEAQAGLAELCALAARGWLDALRLLSREDTTWRPPGVAGDGGSEPRLIAAHWRDGIFERAKAVALAQFEGSVTDDKAGFHRIDAQSHWKRAQFFGDERATQTLEELRKSVPEKHRIDSGFSKHTFEEWQEFRRLEPKLAELPYDWWTLPRAEQHKAAVRFFAQKEDYHAIVIYLTRELPELTSEEKNARANLFLQFATYVQRTPAGGDPELLPTLMEKALAENAGGAELDPALLAAARAEAQRVAPKKP